MVELVDTHVSGACGRKAVRVRLPPAAQDNHFIQKEDYPLFQQQTRSGSGAHQRPFPMTFRHLQASFYILVAFVLLLGCSTSPGGQSAQRDTGWIKNAHYYELPLDELSSTSPMAYLKSKLLPHISSIGANVLVFPPLMQHLPLERDTAGYYRYPICEPTKPHPTYGTLDSIRHVLRVCHEKGLKVVMTYPVWYRGICDTKAAGPRLTPHTKKRDLTSAKGQKELLDILQFWATNLPLDGFVLEGWQMIPKDFRQTIYSTLHHDGIGLIADSQGAPYPTPMDADAYLNYALYKTFEGIYNGAKNANDLETFVLDTTPSPVSIGFTSTLSLNYKEGTDIKHFKLAAKSFAEFALLTQRASWLLAGQEIPASRAYSPSQKANLNYYRGGLVQAYRRIWNAPRENPALQYNANTSLNTINLHNPNAVGLERKWRGYRWISIFNFSDSTSILLPDIDITNINAYITEVSISIPKMDTLKMMRWQNLLLTKH